MIKEGLVFTKKDWPFLVNFNFSHVAILREKKMANFGVIKKLRSSLKGIDIHKYVEQTKSQVTMYADHIKNEIIKYAEQIKVGGFKYAKEMKNKMGNSIAKSDTGKLLKKYDEKAGLFVKSFYDDKDNYLLRILEVTLVIIVLSILFWTVRIVKKKFSKKEDLKKDKSNIKEIESDDKKKTIKPKWKKPEPVSQKKVGDVKPINSPTKPAWKKPDPVISTQTKPAWKKPDPVISTQTNKQTNANWLGQTKEKVPIITEANKEVKKGWLGGKRQENSEIASKPAQTSKVWFGKNNEDDATVIDKAREPKKGWFGGTKEVEKEPSTEKNKSGWFSKKEESEITELPSANVKDDNKCNKSWFSFGKKREEVSEQEDTSNTNNNIKNIICDEAVKIGHQLNLNIDPNPRSRKDTKQSKNKTIDVVKRMGSKVRELKELSEAGDEELNDRKQDMDKIKHARSFFKEGAKRAQSLGGVPRVKLISDEDFVDAYKRDSSVIRKRGFEVGKLSAKDSKIFEEGNTKNIEVNIRKTPRRKLMTLEQVMKLDNSNLDSIKINRDMELDELRDARPTPILKRWQPREEQEKPSEIQTELLDLTQSCKGVRRRWQPVSNDRPTKTRSMDVPHKILRINDFIDPEVSRIDPSEEAKKERSMEIEQIRESRPTPVTKRWRPNQQEGTEGRRSKSVSAVPRAKLLADNDWMRNSSNSRVVERRMETTLEIEQVKIARALELQKIEDEESVNRDKYIQLKIDTKKELEEIRHVRARAMEEQEEALENARKESVNRRAKELALLALELQKSKERREAGEASDEFEPTVQQVEVNQRLQELATLAKCGTLDIAIAMATESIEK